MIFTETKVAGAFLIQPQLLEDDRGFFARTYCVRELEARNISPQVVQRSISYNRLRGTLRGLHFQLPPHEENKFVSCIRGSVYDVIVDLRPASSTFRTWFATVLSADALSSLYVPQGCAHGFITLADSTTVQYDISEFYDASSAHGIRYDDPAFGIEWPMPPVVMGPRDLGFSRWSPPAGAPFRGNP